jgi:hypothetical protein
MEKGREGVDAVVTRKSTDGECENHFEVVKPGSLKMRQVKTRGKDGEIKCTAVDKTFVLDRFHT